MKKWHGSAIQHAKFKTTKHRERKAKSGKEVLNTQDSNVLTQTQVDSQRENEKKIDMEIDENLNVDVGEREGKSKQKRGRKPVKRLDVNASARMEASVTTRCGRMSKRPDFLMPQF